MSEEHVVVLDQPVAADDGVVISGETPPESPSPAVPETEPVGADPSSVQAGELTGREIRSRKRHQALANENSWLRTRLESFQAELEARDKAVEEWKAEAARHQDKYENSIEERIVDSEEEARQKLRQARIDGDVDAEVMYTDRLAELKADRARMDMIKIMPDGNSGHQEQVFYPNHHDVSPPVPQEAQAIHEPLAHFYDRNPWADPDSPQFNQARAEKLSQRSDTLDEMLEEQGKTDLFGTDSYFRILENVCRSDEQPVLAAPVHVAPPSAFGVDRPGASRADVWMQSHGSGSMSVVLTPQELQIARNIGAAHGWSEKEAISKYSENKQRFDRRMSDRSLDERDLNVVPL